MRRQSFDVTGTDHPGEGERVARRSAWRPGSIPAVALEFLEYRFRRTDHGADAERPVPRQRRHCPARFLDGRPPGTTAVEASLLERVAKTDSHTMARVGTPGCDELAVRERGWRGAAVQKLRERDSERRIRTSGCAGDVRVRSAFHGVAVNETDQDVSRR